MEKFSQFGILWHWETIMTKIISALILSSALIGCSQDSSNNQTEYSDGSQQFIVNMSKLSIGDLLVTPDVLEFGEVGGRVKEKTIKLTLKNPTTSAIPLAFVFTPSPGFSVKINRCPTEILAKKSCDITLAFNTRNLFNGEYSTGAEINTVALPMTAEVIDQPDPSSSGQPELKLAFKDKTFAEPDSVPYRTIVLSNIGTGNLTLSLDDMLPEYTIRLNRCSSVLKPKASCEIQVFQKGYRQNQPSADPIIVMDQTLDSETGTQTPTENVVYTPVWENPPAPTIEPCVGQVAVTQILVDCKKSNNSPVSKSLCSHFTPETGYYQSPAGEAPVPEVISGGVLYSTCSAGDTVKSNSRVVCDTEYYDNGAYQCPQRVYLAEWRDAENNLSRCGGTHTVDKVLDRCYEQHGDQQTVANEKCSGITPPTMVIKSPEELVPELVSIPNGTEQMICYEGATLPVLLSRTCIGDSFDTGRDCDIWNQSPNSLEAVANFTRTGPIATYDDAVRGVSPLSNNKVVFIRTDRKDGVGLYTTDMESSVITKLTSPIPQNNLLFPISTNSKYIYWGDDAEGWNIWETDGTQVGTKKIKTLFPSGRVEPYSAINAPQYFYKSGNYYFFSVTQYNTSGEHTGYGLVRTDGSVGGTGYFALQGGVNATIPTGLMGYNEGSGEVMFCARIAASPASIGHIRFNGSTFAPMYTFSNGGGTYCVPNNYTSEQVGNFTFFARAIDTQGKELAIFNRSNSTINNIDFWAGASPNNGFDIETNLNNKRMIVLGSDLIVYAKRDATTGFELYKVSTAGAVTLLKNINETANASSFIENMTLFNNRVYFFANNGSGSKMYRTDGTPTGTIVVPGQESTGSYMSKMFVFNNRLYFFNQGYYGATGAEVCSLNTSEAMSCFDINPGSGSSLSSIDWESATIAGSYLYFTASDGTGKSLFRISMSNTVEKVIDNKGRNLSFTTDIAKSPTRRPLIGYGFGINHFFGAVTHPDYSGTTSLFEQVGLSGQFFKAVDGYENSGTVFNQFPIFGGLGLDLSTDTTKGREFGYVNKNIFNIVNYFSGATGGVNFKGIPFKNEIIFKANNRMLRSYDGESFSSVNNTYSPGNIFKDFTIGGRGFVDSPLSLLTMGSDSGNSAVGTELFSYDGNNNQLFSDLTPTTPPTAEDEAFCASQFNGITCVMSGGNRCEWIGLPIGTCSPKTVIGSSTYIDSVRAEKYTYMIGNTNKIYKINNEDSSVTEIPSAIQLSANTKLLVGKNDIYFYSTGLYIVKVNKETNAVFNTNTSATFGVGTSVVEMADGKFIYINGSTIRVNPGGMATSSSSSIIAQGGTFPSGRNELFPIVDSNGEVSRALFFYNVSGQGTEVWTTDGTSAGTYPVTYFSGIEGFDLQSIVGAVQVYKNNIYFLANNAGAGWELWTSNGTVEGTKMLPESIVGSESRYDNTKTPVVVEGGGVYMLGWDDNKLLQYYRYRPEAE